MLAVQTVALGAASEARQQLASRSRSNFQQPPRSIAHERGPSPFLGICGLIATKLCRKRYGCSGPTSQDSKSAHALPGSEQDEQDDDGFSMVPGVDVVTARPIVIVSDASGEASRLLASSAWAQFGMPDAASLTVLSNVRTKKDADAAIEKAANLGAGSAPYGALLIYTLASQDLGEHLLRQCREKQLECFNALEPILAKMETFLEQERHGSNLEMSNCGHGAEHEANTSEIIAVSCGAGNCTFRLVCDALRQFPDGLVKTVKVCPRVSALEEIVAIVQTACESGALVAFTFASPGMSRFMRHQCELAGVPYADLFQPLLVTMEHFLSHPFLGVPGGLDMDQVAEAKLRWEAREVNRQTS